MKYKDPIVFVTGRWTGKEKTTDLAEIKIQLKGKLEHNEIEHATYKKLEDIIGMPVLGSFSDESAGFVADTISIGNPHIGRIKYRYDTTLGQHGLGQNRGQW